MTVLALTNLVYLWGATLNPEGSVFTGFVYTFSFYDILSYLAKMRDGHDGGWFYTNPFTTESIKPVFLFVFYIFLGHLGRWIGVSLVAAYHGARILSGIFLLFSADRMIQAFGWKGPTRLLAFALIFLGGGFGWLVHWTGWIPVPVEFMQTEGFVFQSMINYPHFVLTIALMIWILTEAWRFGTGSGYPSALVGAALAAFLLGWIHPRPLLTLVCVVGLAGLVGAHRGAWSMRPWIMMATTLVLASIVPMVISLITIRADPLWTEWSRTETLSASPWRYLLAYGLLWPLAIIGLVQTHRRNDSVGLFLGAWLIVASVLPYLPISAQGRLIIGWNVPLALLSGYAIGEVFLPRLKGTAERLGGFPMLILLMLIAVMSLSSFAYLGAGVRRVLIGSFPGYISEERSAAMQWLDENTQDEEVVLSSRLTGMFIPAFSGNQVVQGHWAETFHPEEKDRTVRAIFDADLPSADRKRHLDEFSVRYLFYGQWERELGQYDPAQDPIWRPRWQGEITALYERSGFPELPDATIQTEE